MFQRTGLSQIPYSRFAQYATAPSFTGSSLRWRRLAVAVQGGGCERKLSLSSRRTPSHLNPFKPVFV